MLLAAVLLGVLRRKYRDGCHGRTSSGVSDEIEHDIGIDSLMLWVIGSFDWTELWCGERMLLKQLCHFYLWRQLEKEMSPNLNILAR